MNTASFYLRAALQVEQVGEIETAVRLYRKVIDLEPTNYRAYRLLFRATKAQPDDPAFETLSRALCGSLSLNDRIEIHYALGKAYADCGLYDDSFIHYEAGAGFKRRTLTYDERNTLDELNRIRYQFDAKTISKRQQNDGFDSGAYAGSRRAIFVVGMPRSGTTLVEQILCSHPDIFGAGEIPGQALLNGIDFPDGARVIDYEMVVRRYLGLLDQLGVGTRYIVNKLPSNYRLLGLIRLALPEAKIIHVRRDPVDTCWSCFTQLFTDNQVHTYDLGELGRYYFAYDNLMAHWREVLPSSHFLEVRYEDVVGQTRKQTKRMLAFLDLDWDDACERFYETDRPVLTGSVVQVRQPIYKTSIGARAKYGEPLLAGLGIE